MSTPNPTEPVSEPRNRLWHPHDQPDVRIRVGKSDGLLWAWSILCLIWWIAAGATTVGFFVIGMVWVVPAFLLTVIYLVARAGRRRCPVCGVHVSTGVTDCGACGHDFAHAAAQRSVNG